jgi:hypothetical protein
MAYQIRPLARLFRGMADLIDHDHTSHTGMRSSPRPPA